MTTAATTWSDDRILHFIEMYRCRPVLWDIRLSDHKDKEKRRAALVELAEYFDVTKEEVERKIKNLLSHYSREVKKVELGMTCPDFRYRSKWFCFASLQFLRERHNKPRGTIGNSDLQSTGFKTEDGLDTDIIGLSDEHETECDPLEDAMPQSSSHSQSVEIFLSPEQNYVSTLSEERRPFDTSSMSAEDDTLTLLKEISALRQERDEYSLFGEQVAVKLRKLPSPYARMMVQHIINTTLFEAEMGKYDEPAPMSSTLPTFVQPRHRKEQPATSTSHIESKRQRLD